MISDVSIKEHLSALSRREISLDEFEDWFLQAAWDMFRDSSADAISLASSIHLLMSERDDEIFDDAELQKRMIELAFAPTAEVIYAPTPPQTLLIRNMVSRPAMSATRLVQATVQ